MRWLALLAIVIGCDSEGDSSAPPEPDTSPPCLCDAPLPDTEPAPDVTEDGDQCGLDVSDGGACADEGATCWIEGTARCDLDPPGGGCDCAGGHWSCWSGCPEGCPSSMPADDAACAGAIECRYGDGTCRCQDGAFSCSAV